MLRHRLVIAFRTILRNKTNSIINIAGLAIGLACVILISLYVRDELHLTVTSKMRTGFTRLIWMP